MDSHSVHLDLKSLFIFNLFSPAHMSSQLASMGTYNFFSLKKKIQNWILVVKYKQKAKSQSCNLVI